MYPMIAAVHRFISDDNLLRFRTRKNTQWVQLPFVMQEAGISRSPHIECPVALLTNEWTASSGEAVLLCFRSLDYARVFGAPTAGYASANQPFLLPDGSQLVLTTGCDVARTGEVFCDDPIDPDVRTETPLEDAVAWIRNTGR
jgi:C-terminal processing protease CtpA/Prc